ncbi:MAG: dCMP deaminase family protein [Candidatus Sulfotelmatobacter sp.]
MPNRRTALATLNPPDLEGEAYISTSAKIDEWDEYFSLIAEAVKSKSKDPKCQVGAVIVSADKVVLTTGFNGLPRGVDDDSQILDDADEKIKVICHAEQNAIINAARRGIAVQGASIYVTKFPCLACCNSIIQAGITRLFTLDYRFWDDDPFDGEKDGNHWRKRRLIRNTHLVVDAPNHPEYSSIIRIRKKQPRGTKIECKNGVGR